LAQDIYDYFFKSSLYVLKSIFQDNMISNKLHRTSSFLLRNINKEDMANWLSALIMESHL